MQYRTFFLKWPIRWRRRADLVLCNLQRTIANSMERVDDVRSHDFKRVSLCKRFGEKQSGISGARKSRRRDYWSPSPTTSLPNVLRFLVSSCQNSSGARRSRWHSPKRFGRLRAVEKRLLELDPVDIFLPPSVYSYVASGDRWGGRLVTSSSD